MKCINCPVYRAHNTDYKFCRGTNPPTIEHHCKCGESMEGTKEQHEEAKKISRGQK